MMRRTRAIALIAGLAMAAAVFAAAPATDKLLPTKTEMKPWQPVPDSLTYVKRNKLEDIYDGGANVYRKHGVQEAAQQLYQRGKDIMEISVMSIDTPANAKSFYAYFKKSSESPKVVMKSRTGEGFESTGNPVVGYVYTGRYLAAAAPSYSGAKAKKDTETFLKALSKKLENAGKRKKK